MSISIAEFQTAMDIFGARRLPDKEATRSIALVPCYIVKDTILFHSGTDYIVQENPDYVSFNRAKQKLELRKGHFENYANLDICSLRGLMTYVCIIRKKQKKINSIINATYSTLLANDVFSTAVPVSYNYEGSKKLQELRNLITSFDKMVFPFSDKNAKVNTFTSYEKYLNYCTVRINSPFEVSSIEMSGKQFDFSLICDDNSKTYYTSQFYRQKSKRVQFTVSHTFVKDQSKPDEIIFIQLPSELKAFISLKSGLTWRPYGMDEAQMATDTLIELIINLINLSIELLQKRIISHIISV